MYGIKLDLRHGLKLSPNEFNHLIDRPEYMILLRHRLIIAADRMSDSESKAVLIRLEDWLDHNATNTYHVRQTIDRIEIYVLEPNDAMHMKLALQGSEIEVRLW